MPSQPYPQQRDESYWQSLFAEEEKLSDSHSEFEPDLNTLSEAQATNKNNTASDTAKLNGQDPWRTAQQWYETDKPIELQVIGFNKGGLLVNWYGLQGFIPASQVLNFPQCRHITERLDALQNWLHQLLTLKIVEVDPPQNRLIFSERAAQSSAQIKAQLLAEINPGDQVHGQVTNLTDFGAFVDLGGFEGLIHLSELSWSRVNHPLDIVEPGQRLTVKVLRVDRKADRIALSLKQIKPDPWSRAEERYQPGQLVEGVVSNIVNYGAFVQVEDELEGLIHLSELAEGSFLHPHNVVQYGEKVVARVLNVDSAAKRLALSLRHVGQEVICED